MHIVHDYVHDFIKDVFGSYIQQSSTHFVSFFFQCFEEKTDLSSFI